MSAVRNSNIGGRSRLKRLIGKRPDGAAVWLTARRAKFLGHPAWSTTDRISFVTSSVTESKGYPLQNVGSILSSTCRRNWLTLLASLQDGHQEGQAQLVGTLGSLLPISADLTKCRPGTKSARIKFA